MEAAYVIYVLCNKFMDLSLLLFAKNKGLMFLTR